MKTTLPILRALAHALIGVTLGFTTLLIASSADLALSGRIDLGGPARYRVVDQGCPCNVPRDQSLEAASPTTPVTLTGQTS